MKKIKYRITLAITSLFLLLTTLSINTIPIQAATSVVKGDFISGGGITTTYRNSPSWIWSLSIGMNSITVGGEIAYCLEPARSVSTNNATSVNFNSLTQVNVGSESRPDAPKATVTKAMQVSLSKSIAGLSGSNIGIGVMGIDTLNFIDGISLSLVFSIFLLIAVGYSVIKVFFSNLKRGGILLTQMAVGSLYMISVPRGFVDGFTNWSKQVIALTLTTFLQTVFLVAGLMVFKDSLLLGIGLMMSANEIPRIADQFGLETTTRGNFMGTMYATQSFIHLVSHK